MLVSIEQKLSLLGAHRMVSAGQIWCFGALMFDNLESLVLYFIIGTTIIKQGLHKSVLVIDSKLAIPFSLYPPLPLYFSFTSNLKHTNRERKKKRR